jgi:hypothetical protein
MDWFFWDVGFSGYGLDSEYRSTNITNVLPQRSLRKSTIALFKTFSNSFLLSKNPGWLLVETPYYLQGHHNII